jgi:hypothetical protein
MVALIVVPVLTTSVSRGAVFLERPLVCRILGPRPWLLYLRVLHIVRSYQEHRPQLASLEGVLKNNAGIDKATSQNDRHSCRVTAFNLQRYSSTRALKWLTSPLSYDRIKKGCGYAIEASKRPLKADKVQDQRTLKSKSPLAA